MALSSEACNSLTKIISLSHTLNPGFAPNDLIYIVLSFNCYLLGAVHNYSFHWHILSINISFNISYSDFFLHEYRVKIENIFLFSHFKKSTNKKELKL